MPDLFEGLRLFITNARSRSRLDVGGELDMAAVGPMEDHLALLVDAGLGDVDIDMALVTFCDATSLRVLVAVDNQLRANGRRLSVVDASRPVLRLLEITGLETLLSGVAEDGDASHHVSPPDRHRSAEATRREEHLDADRQALRRFAG